MTLEQTPNVAKRRLTLRNLGLGGRLTVILIPLVLIPLLAMGIGAYLRSRALLRDQAASQMTSAAQAQISVLQDWTDEREQRLQLGTQRSALLAAVNDLLNAPTNSPRFRSARDAALAELEDLRIRQGQVLFSDLLIARPDGSIIVSTQSDWEGQTSSFLAGDNFPIEELHSHPIHNDNTIAPDNLAILSHAPLRSGGTQAAATIIGINADARLGALFEDMQIFWEQRGIYRVERGRTFALLSPDVLIQLERYGTAPTVSSGVRHPIFSEMGAIASGTMEYINVSGDLVLAAYEWIPEWEMGIVAELPQEDIFAEINNLAPFSIALIGGTTVVTLFLVAVVANRLLRPLGTLTQAAARLAGGDWDSRVEAEREDEIGALAFNFNAMAQELSNVYRSLESRVDERTRQIRTASEVARAVISTPSLEDLLRRAVELLRQQFSYDHVSIFLLDDKRTSAVLRAATGEIGDALRAQGFSIPLIPSNIIGWVATNNQPRLISEVKPEDVSSRGDLLTSTRSELAVPLQIADRVLGAINVQSFAPDAFRPQDIEMLQTLADQLSAAIQNARLAQRSASAADRARLVSRITAELSSPLELNEVMERAARAVQHGLGSPEVMIKVREAQAGVRLDDDSDDNG
jgi:GAF domain-containing protein/HAMP domain-containing protein